MHNRINVLTDGFRQRWMRGSILAVAIMVVLAVASFAVVTASSLHSTVRTGLESKAKTATDFFANYITKTYAEYYDSAYKYAEAFEDGDKIELEFVGTDNRIIVSTYGLAAGTRVATQDIADAIKSGEIRSWSGRHPSTHEHIISVSAPMIYSDGQVIGVMRYMTSLRNVDRQTFFRSLIAVALGVGMLFVVVLMNLLFIRSFVEPVGEITHTAKRIAEGSYGIQIEKTYGEEIGDMVAAINEMSLKIAQSERMQSEFVSSVSHELRTPLTAISGWGETLLYNKDLDVETRRGITIILKESRRLSKMVEELLEFTRIEDGRFSLNIEPTDVAAELEDTIFAYRDMLRQEAIDLVYTPPEEDIPLIPADPARLRQVFLNIFDNAAKYAKDGRRIEASIGYDLSFVTVNIRDFGPGLPEDELENVKMKFYKGSNAKERGSGIGLAVCDEIIKYHGGSLKLSNAEGGGLLITIHLPLSSARSA